MSNEQSLVDDPARLTAAAVIYGLAYAEAMKQMQTPEVCASMARRAVQDFLRYARVATTGGHV
jgi:hypothetical protein